MILWCNVISTTQLYQIKPEIAHGPWVQTFDKNLKPLIYLGYWSTKRWRCLVSEKDAKATINLVELKFAKLKSNEILCKS